jgi:hypothetical protein
MPLNLQINDQMHSIPYSDLSELRVALIGNKDLKFRLVGDVNFISHLVAQFNHEINQSIQNKSSAFYALNDYAVIINILVVFISEVNTNKFHSVSKSLKRLELTFNPIINVVNYFVRNIDLFTETTAVELLINCCLDILLGFANIRNHAVDGGSLLRLITTSLIVTHGERLQNTVFKLAKLIPLLLLSPLDLTPLSIALFSRLNGICSIIVDTHLPRLSDHDLKAVAFGDTLPNLNLNEYFLSTHVNTQLLMQLIIASAQLLLQQGSGSSFGYSQVPPNDCFTGDSNDISIKTFIALLLLVKCDDNLMSITSLNLICFYLTSRHASDQFVFQNYNKLLPRIVDLLGLDTETSKYAIGPQEQEPEAELPLYLLSPIRIAADYCLHYPVFSDDFRRANIDLKLVSKLQVNYKSNQLFKLLSQLKTHSNHGTKLCDFTSLIHLHRQDNCLLGDLLLLLSVYTSKNESHRQRLVKSESQSNIMPQIIFELMDIYHFLLNQLHLIYRIVMKHKSGMKMIPEADLSWIGKNLGIIINLLDNNTFTTCLYLIRSLSRSISTSRTFFVECNAFKSFITPPGTKDPAGGLITNLLRVIKCYEKAVQIMEYFYQTTLAVNNYEIQVLNESIILGIISNFIRECSSFTYNIVNYDNFFQSLSVVYATNGKFECTELQEYQYNTIQLNVLQILRNYMGIETNENKKNLFEYIPLTAILEKASFGLIKEDVSLEIKPLRIQQKLVAMDILRNCTAGSETLCDEITVTYDKKFVSYYPSLPRKWFDFVIANITNFELFDETGGSIEDDDFILKMLGNEDYVKLITSINFIENHKYTKSRITQKEFPPDGLLSIWLKFLKLEIPGTTGDSGSINARVTVTNNLNEVKLSIVWIIINLTMYTSRYGLTMSSETSYKLFDTVQLRPDIHESTQKIDIDEGDIEPIVVSGATSGTNEEEMTIKDRAIALQAHGFFTNN